MPGFFYHFQRMQNGVFKHNLLFNLFLNILLISVRVATTKRSRTRYLLIIESEKLNNYFLINLSFPKVNGSVKRSPFLNKEQRNMSYGKHRVRQDIE